MRKIIVTEFMTIDGVVEAPGGGETSHPHTGWQVGYGSPETGKYKVDELAAIDALLLGRNTYELFAAYWPNQSGDGFPDRMNALPKYVVSGELQDAGWNNSQVLRNADEVAALKQTAGGDILVYGSATLVRSLLQAGLVDELRLMICPVSVGGGQRLFDDNRALEKFKLKQAKTYENGIVVLEYEPLR